MFTSWMKQWTLGIPSVLNISVVIVIEYSTKRLKTLCGSLERAILFVAGSRSSGAVQCLLMPW